MSFRTHIQGGYTLLEVLIALLVFSLGLLGMAAMMVSAVRGNHQAFHHSQATYVADSITDGLRANLEAVNANAYNTDGFISTHASSDCQPCSPAQLADKDLNAWALLASSRLPGGEMNIDCDRIGLPEGVPQAAYNGICHIRLRWVEGGDTGQQEDTTQVQFSWMVQP
jgi:type IV pilus assembly protein PilV